QGRALQEQAEELSRREQSLASQLHQWCAAQQELASLQETSLSIRKDAAAQRTLLEALKSETEALQRSREVARTELEALVKAMKEQSEARAVEEAIRTTGQAQLEQRRQAVERLEKAMRQRLAEVDDL